MTASGQPAPVPEAPAETLSGPWFHAILFALCLAYFLLELFYISHLPLVMDEFQGGAAVYRLRHEIPYLDFQPYKTVVGYYVQLPAMSLGSDVWSRLMRVKQWMALLTACGLFGVGSMLAQSFRRHAVLLAFGALLCVSTFLERSAALRVDMLTALVGFASFALLLWDKPTLAGLVAGLSLTFSQKGAYYCVAGGIALGTYWLVRERTRRRFGDAAMFTLCACSVMALYVAVFAVLGVIHGVSDTARGVTHATVVSPQAIAFDLMYKRLGEYWLQTVTRNPYYYAVAVLGIGAAFETTRERGSFRDWAVWTYAGVVLSGCLWHKQPWPYFFVLLLPTLSVPAALLFERVVRRGAWLFWLLFATLGVAFPLQRIDVVAERDASYQRYTVQLAEAALGPRDTYLAGIDIIHTRRQSPRSLAWLDMAGVKRAKKYGVSNLIEDLATEPPKFVIWNYRLNGLAPPVTLYLRRSYSRLSGSLWAYGPTIDKRDFRIAHTGRYRLRGPLPSVFIDGKLVERGQTVKLTAGVHHTDQPKFRLRWMPDPKTRRFLDDDFKRREKFFNGVYHY